MCKCLLLVRKFERLPTILNGCVFFVAMAINIASAAPVMNNTICAEARYIHTRAANTQFAQGKPKHRWILVHEHPANHQIGGVTETVKSSKSYKEMSNSDTGCPEKQMMANATATINERSICPWYYVLNKDPLRMPKMLMEARCKCHECLPIGVTVPSKQHQCELVYTTIQVLKRIEVCENGQDVYSFKQETIATSCACAGKRFHVSRPM